MKKIITPKQHEEALYFSDFTGEPFDSSYSHPPVNIKISFNYGSKYDGSEIILHLSDKDIEPILKQISSKLNPDFKKSLENELEENNEEYFNAIEARDPMMCEYYISCNSLIKKLLG